MKTDKLIAKSRRFEMVVFAESLPDGWKDYLDGTGYPIAYILHDRDYDDDTGELKKPHYHLLIDAGASVKTSTIYNAICEPLGHSNLPKPIKPDNRRYDYLTHKNDPDKAQYDESEIVLLNDFNRAAYEKRSRLDTDQVDLFNYITDLIELHDIRNFYALSNYLRYNNEYEAQKLLIYKPNMFKQYMQDRIDAKIRSKSSSTDPDPRWLAIVDEIAKDEELSQVVDDAAC